MEEQPRKFYLSVSNLGEPLYDDIVNSDLPKEEKVKQIKWRGQAYRDELDDQLHKDYARIGLGGLVSAVGALPIAITKNPVIGSAIGGGVYELGQGIMEGDELPELMQRAGWGGAIGGTVGGAVSKLPDAARFVNNLSGGRIGNALKPIGEKIAQNPAVQKAYDVLMTDIRAFNPNKQTVYHGSPYDFNKFSNEAIGTGEGAQAHGMGHYAALDKNIADNRYRKRQLRTVEEREVDSKYKPLFDKEQKIFDAKSRELYNLRFKDNKLSEEEYQKGIDEASKKTYEILDEWHNAINNIDKTKATKETGQLYKLSVPKDDVMLREDLPFSEQPKAVQDVLKKLAKDYKDIGYGDLLDSIGYDEKGESFYRLYNRLAGNGENAARELSDRGIKGISYNGGIDGEARVIFNPDDIVIGRKYYNQPNLYQQLTGKQNTGALYDALLNR